MLAEMISCNVDAWPIKYLGVPLGGQPRSTTFWDLVVEKVSKKLACWKKYISLGGKITLIKVALNNIPIYYMSLFKMPHKVAIIVEKCQRYFLWEGCKEWKDHLMKWEDMTKSKENDGLGIGKLKEKNQAFWENNYGDSS